MNPTLKQVQGIFRKILFLAAFCFALAVRATAQTTTVTDANVTMTEINGTTNLWQGFFVVSVSDSINVSQIKVLLGTSDNAGDICNRTFDYDVTTALPQGCSYSRVGNKLVLGIGTFSERNTYFGSAQVKSSNGNWGGEYKLVAN